MCPEVLLYGLNWLVANNKLNKTITIDINKLDRNLTNLRKKDITEYEEVIVAKHFPYRRVSMGLTVNRQMALKLTVNRQERNIFTVNRQMSEPKLAVKLLRYP